MNDQEARTRVARIEASLEEIEALPDPKSRAVATEALQNLLELYGEGLARIMTAVNRLGHDDIAQAFMGDELVTHLLLLHDVHPISVEARVQQALEEVRPYLASHGGNVEFLGVERGVARLRLQGSCKGCPSSTETLRAAIEQAIQKAAPELVGVEAEGAVEPAPPAGFIPLSSVHLNSAKPVAAAV